MELYFLRHAPAASRGSKDFPDDSLRPLTLDGIRKMRRIAKGMKSLELKFDLILSSPYLRAKQTAEIVAEEFAIKDRLDFSKALAAEAKPEIWVPELIRLNRKHKRILLVGHEPFLSGLISLLLAGNDQLQMNFKKGGLCMLETEAIKFGPCASLNWILTPRQLIRMK